MKTYLWPHLVRARFAQIALLLLAFVLVPPGRALADDCGGALSGSTGNVVGSIAGAVGGGLLGSQFGGGAGKGLITGLGGRQAEGGCNARRPAAAQAAAGRACRYVSNPATIDGQTQQLVGVACLDPDGVWRTATDPGANQAANTDLVLRAQQRLHDQGYYVRNNIDGRWGPGTSTAVRNFQQANGVAPTGQLDAPTQTALGVGPVALADLGQPAQQAAPTAQAAPPPPATTPVSTDSSIYK
jgi:hypothetical protein